MQKKQSNLRTSRKGRLAAVIDGKLQLKHASAAKKSDMNKNTLKMKQDIGIADQQKA